MKSLAGLFLTHPLLQEKVWYYYYFFKIILSYRLKFGSIYVGEVCWNLPRYITVEIYQEINYQRKKKHARYTLKLNKSINYKCHHFLRNDTFEVYKILLYICIWKNLNSFFTYVKIKVIFTNEWLLTIKILKDLASYYLVVTLVLTFMISIYSWRCTLKKRT